MDMSALGSTMRRVARDVASVSLRARAETAATCASAERLRRWADPRAAGAREPSARGFSARPSERSWGASPWWAASSSRRTAHSSAASDFAAADADADASVEDDDERPSSQYDFANKPSRGVNRWKRARKKAAFIKANARTHRENKTARAEEREMKRLERWRTLAATQRAWNAAKREQAMTLESGRTSPGADAEEGTKREAA